MKVSQEDYAAMAEAITDMPAEPTMRERWDALWRAVDAGRLSYDTLRPYLDDHIDTALRRIGRSTTA